MLKCDKCGKGRKYFHPLWRNNEIVIVLCTRCFNKFKKEKSKSIE